MHAGKDLKLRIHVQQCISRIVEANQTGNYKCLLSIGNDQMVNNRISICHILLHITTTEKCSQIYSFLTLFNRLNGKHVVFGSVVEGMDVVKKIEGVGSQSGKTSKEVKITASGQL